MAKLKNWKDVDDDTRIAVESEVKKHWDKAKVAEVKITDQNRDFFRGTLYFVSIYLENKEEHENYVFVRGETLMRFSGVKDLALALGRTNPAVYLLESLFQSTGISGIIAVIITLTICIGAFRAVDGDILKILGLALTTILGFYFGSSSKSKRASKLVIVPEL